VQRAIRDFLTVFADFTDARDSAPGIVERDVVAYLFEVDLGLWHEIGAHLLFPLLGGFGVFAFKTIENFDSGLRLPAFPTFVDFTA